MRGRRSPRQRIGTLVLGVSVFLATAPDAYGLGECPFHAHASALQADPAASHGRDHGDPADDPEHPCTWLADCNICLLPPTLPGDHPDEDFGVGSAPDLAPVPSVEALLGPRHRLFELHLPNAPPVSLP